MVAHRPFLGSPGSHLGRGPGALSQSLGKVVMMVRLPSVNILLHLGHKWPIYRGIVTASNCDSFYMVSSAVRQTSHSESNSPRAA